MDLVNKLFYGCKRINLVEFFRKNTIVEFEAITQNLKNLTYLNDAEITELVKIYIEKINEDTKETEPTKYTLPRRFYDRLTLDHMLQLEKEFPELRKNLAFIKDLLIKKFEIEAEGIAGIDYNSDKYEQNIKELDTILGWCEEHLDQSMHTVNSTIKLKLLEYTLVRGEYDFNLFNDYLKNPIELKNTLFSSVYLK